VKCGAILAQTLLVLFLGSACEPVRSTPLQPVGAADLRPTRRDPDAGQVGIRADFDLEAYRAIEVAPFAVAASPAWGFEERRIVSAVRVFFQSDLARRLRASGLFEHVLDPQASPPVGSAGVLRLEGTVSQLELDYLAPSRHWRWVGPGSVQVETRFVDAASGRVVLVTADRRTARYVTSAARDVAGTEARLEEVFDYLADDLLRFLVRVAAPASPLRPSRGPKGDGRGASAV
jgi:hypothetical protein